MKTVMGSAIWRVARLLVLVTWAVCGSNARALPALGQQPPKAEEVLTNDSIIQMVTVGLDQELILLKIRKAKTNFNLSSSELVRLRGAGVGTEILKCMLDPESCQKPASGAVPPPPAAAPKAEPASSVEALMGSIAPKTGLDDYKEPGVYLWAGEGRAPTRIDLRTLGQAKVGGRLGRVVTLGVKSEKQKAYLLGHTAKLRIKDTDQPVFYIRIPEGASIDEYVLVELDQKDDRREIEVGSSGGFVGSKQGLRFEQIRPWQPQEVSRGIYKAVPNAPLARGEYLVYIVGSADSMKGIMGKGYDFGIE